MTLTVVDILGPELAEDEPIPYVLAPAAVEAPPVRFVVTDWSRVGEHPLARDLDAVCDACGARFGEHVPDDPHPCPDGAP